MNEPLKEPHEPLTDEQLDQFFKAARPTMPADWQDRFWQDLDPKLEQPARPDAQTALGWLSLAKKPWAAAAAALIVILLALPLSQKVAQQAEKSSLDMADQPMAEQPSQPAMLGASVEHEPGAALQNRQASRKAQDGKTDVSGNAGRTDTEEAVSRARTDDSKTKPERDRALSHKSAPNAPTDVLGRPKTEAGFNRPEESGDETKVLSKSQTKDKFPASPQLRKQNLDPLGERLEAMLRPLHGELRQLQPGSYEIRVPAARSAELEAGLSQLAVPHNKLTRALKEHDQIVYRLDIL
ncbi:MAG TPA: hypothetical protein V6D23_16855 [Candidatus Obscuribacterales bacterium]